MPFRDAFKEFPRLETDRLVLRKLLPSDAEAYFSQQKSALHLPGRPPWAYGFETESVSNVAASFKYTHNAWLKKVRLKWGLVLKDEKDAIIGQCELFDIQNQSKAEVGYWLGASYHNQGLMMEALSAIVDYAFGTMAMHRLYAKTATKNTSSVALLQRVGFVQEGVLRQDTRRDGEWTDTALLAILKSDREIKS